MPAQAGRAWSAQSLLEGEGDRKTRQGESWGGQEGEHPNSEVP